MDRSRKLERFHFKTLSMTFSTQRQKVSHKCLFSVFPKVFLHTAGKNQPSKHCIPQLVSFPSMSTALLLRSLIQSRNRSPRNETTPNHTASVAPNLQEQLQTCELLMPRGKFPTSPSQGRAKPHVVQSCSCSGQCPWEQTRCPRASNNLSSGGEDRKLCPARASAVSIGVPPSHGEKERKGEKQKETERAGSSKQRSSQAFRTTCQGIAVGV